MSSSSRCPGSELGVSEQGSEGRSVVTASVDEVVEQLDRRRVPLQRGDVAEQRHGVVVEDPVVLRSDRRRDRGRRRPGEDRRAVAAQYLQVVEQPFIVVALLRNVLGEVRGEGRADRIGRRELLGASPGGFHQGNACADGAMKQEEEFRIEVGDPRIDDESAARPDQIREDELDL